MSSVAMAEPAAHAVDRHPKGLYVLFATEMWERFSFYSMLAMFTLYVQDATEGFGWTQDRATTIYSNYLMFVYASPLIGGWLADKKLGYRRAVMIGGFFFMAGHLLLSFRSVPIMYTALVCLVIGNGFFKPNVSTMVGRLYPEGSHLKDRAFLIFYMGINIGAFLGPVVAEVVKTRFGFHPAFAVAAGGMLISVSLLWKFKHLVEGPERGSAPVSALRKAPAAAVTTDAPPPEGSGRAAAYSNPIDAVPDWKRIAALIVIFLIAIVFWMAFHQNGSTWTYFADKNTDWSVSGIISNAINPFWIIALVLPLSWFWRWLDRKGKEPSTPTKMVFGILLTALAYFIMYLAGKAGGDFGKVSPLWLINAYMVISLGELMLSPMALSLVSKVAPIRMRGLMMGGWFFATAMGNKLTAIGVYWDDWLHSTFFAVVGGILVATALLLVVLLKPLKKAMPGI